MSCEKMKKWTGIIARVREALGLLKSPPPEKEVMEKIHAKVHRVVDLRKLLGKKAPNAAEMDQIIEIAAVEVLQDIRSQAKQREQEQDRLRKLYLHNQQKGGQKC